MLLVSRVLLVYDGMSAAPTNQPHVHREANGAGHEEREGEASPKERGVEPGVHRVGNREHDRVVDGGWLDSS